MPHSHRKRLTFLVLEALEDRCNPSTPTLLANLPLPGAGSTWDFSKGPFTAAPAVADLDGDGQQEVLATGGDGQLYAYKYNRATGSFDPRLFSLGGFAAPIVSTPLVVDIAGRRAVFTGTVNGVVFGWDARTGAVLPGWPQSVHAPSINPIESVYGSIAAGDLDGDGVPELVVTAFNHEVTAFHADGSVMWRFNNDDTVFSSAVIGDLNGDGRPEVVVGGDSSASQFYWQGGRINALSWNGRREWVKRTDQVIWSSPLLADLKGDGRLEVVVGTGYLPAGPPHVGNFVYALDAQGNDLPGWPYTTGDGSIDASTYSSPAVGDLLGDGRLEVVIGDGHGQLHAVRPNGQALWKVQAFDAQNLYTSPVIADVTGGNQPDVVIAAEGVMRAFAGNTGAQVWTNFDLLPHFNAAAVGRLKGDGSYQMAIIANARGSSNSLLSPSSLQIFDLGPTTLTPPWGQFRQDAGHNAVARSAGVETARITSLYTNALGRPPSAAELSTVWLPQFTRAGNLRPLILGIVASNEARAIQVNKYYQTYLGRSAEAGGLTNWLNSLAAGQRYATVQAAIAGSPESFSRAGGTNTAWVRLIYQKILGRTSVSDPEIAGWVSVLDTGRLDRTQVTLQFLLSPEYTNGLVNQWYAAYGPGGLTSAPPDSLAALGWDLRRGKAEEQALADLLNSNGDYVAAQQEGSWLRASYQDMLQRAPSTGEVVMWLGRMEAGLPLAAIANVISHSAERNAVLAKGYFQTFLHRTPSPADQAFFANLLNNGTPRVSVINTFVASDEYFARAGNDVATYIRQVFMDLFGRPARDSDVSNWLNQAARGNIRQLLPAAALFQVPAEFDQKTISDLYFLLLRRLPSTPADQSRLINPGVPFGGQVWVNQLLAGVNPADIETQLLISPEYLGLALNKALWLGARWLS